MIERSRINDMLTTYGDKAVAAVQAAAEKIQEPPSSFAIQHARHQGECRAWAVHDSYFVWTKPLSNDFAELKAFVMRDAPPESCAAVTDWTTLHTATENRAAGFLARQDYPPLPAFLTGEHETYWWQLMAIMHECDRQLGRQYEDCQRGK